MIRLDNVHKRFAVGEGHLHVLRGVQLHVPEGELLAIMGSSGSGKSTLLNVLGILDGYEEGTYWLGDTLVKAPLRASGRRGAQPAARVRVPELPSAARQDRCRQRGVAADLSGSEPQGTTSTVAGAPGAGGLLDWADAFPPTMSGGQKQRVAIARALVTRPRVVLADEPTGALDAVTTDEIMGLLQEVNADGMTVVVVTHEEEIGARCDRVLRLVQGRFDA